MEVSIGSLGGISHQAGTCFLNQIQIAELGSQVAIEMTAFWAIAALC
ncbi:hypothetical protein [Pseudomonas sp. TE21394]